MLCIGAHKYKNQEILKSINLDLWPILKIFSGVLRIIIEYYQESCCYSSKEPIFTANIIAPSSDPPTVILDHIPTLQATKGIPYTFV